MNKNTAVGLAVKNTFFLYVSNFIVQIIGFFISVYIIKVLSVQDYGVYSFVLGSMMFIHMFSTSSPSTVIARFVPEFIEYRSYRLILKVYLMSLCTVILTLLVFALFMEFSSSWIEKFFKLPGFSGYTHYIIFFIFGYITLMLGRTYNSTFLLQKVSAAVHISASVIRLLMYIYFWSKLNLRIVLFVESITYSVEGLFQLAIPYFIIRSKMHLNEERHYPLLRRRIMKYGILSFFNEIGAGMLNRSTNNYIISAMSDAAMLGQYGFANKVNDVFIRLFPLNQIAGILRPIFIRKYTAAKDRHIMLNRMFVFLYKFLFFILAPICLYFVSVSDIIIADIFDPKYLDSLLITNLIFMFTLFNAFQLPLGYVVQSIEKLEINLYSKVFFIYNIVGSILVMRISGLTGVVIVLGTSILFKNLFILFGIRKYIKLSFPGESLLRIFLGAVLIAAVNIVLRNYFKINAYAELVLLALIDIPLYFGLARVYSPFKSDEREVINIFMNKIKLGFVRL